jgi:hypothetical protein
MQQDFMRSYFEKAVHFHAYDKFQDAHDLYKAILEIEPNNNQYN